MCENYEMVITREAVNSHEFDARDTIVMMDSADETQADPESVIAKILIKVLKGEAV